MVKYSLVLAMGINGEIGTNNSLPWGKPIKQDMESFKTITRGLYPLNQKDRACVVMGRNTFESIGSVPLKNRFNVVISQNLHRELKSSNDLMFFASVEAFKEFAEKGSTYFGKTIDFYCNPEEIFIIGGQSIYEQFFDVATKIYVTYVGPLEYRSATHYFPKEKLFNGDWEQHFIEKIRNEVYILDFYVYTRNASVKKQNIEIKSVKSLQDLGTELGGLLEEKNKAYGSAFDKAGEFLKLLYPTGIQPEQYGDALALVRIFDKQMRIATSKKAFSEEPYKDIGGYGILGWKKGLEV